VAVVAALTHIRSRPWLEQMMARATRVDPHAGPYESQRALVFHPDDPLFARFRRSIETEQGTLARARRRNAEAGTPSWLTEYLAAHRDEGEGRGITPLESNALGLRYATLRPGPASEARPGQKAAAAQLIEPPSAAERRLRARIGDAVAAQAVEDETGLQVPRAGEGLYHRYNAVLKRVFGGKGRAQMTLPELEAALAWLERNRLYDHLSLLEGDNRYAWTAARRRSGWSQRRPHLATAATRPRSEA
jgi:hypothetical protein